MAGPQFDQAQLDIRVERDLRVTLTPTKPVVNPGEDVTLDVTTVDQLGEAHGGRAIRWALIGSIVAASVRRT